MVAKDRKAWSLLGNSQRLDGGAMFGNVPRALWSQWIAPDERNRIPLACRALLVREGDRHLLFETGVGAFLPPPMRDRYGVQEERHVLLQNLRVLGLSDEDIDVVVLSHLHFDHAGGLLAAYEEDAPASLLFPNATYVVSADAWERAKRPHSRDRRSFIPELQPLLEESGRLEIVRGPRSKALGDDYRLWLSHGHTPGLMLTEIATADGPIVYAADLVPGQAWVHLPVSMGYDRNPEQLIDEKAELLGDLVDRNGRLFFTHDHQVAVGRVARDGKGRFFVQEAWAELQGAPL